ncbi:hypothetical protein HMPREF1982_04194 [Clostridiales bacterium oral taxon 876 str. F0540]|nr:hypothetical protein HMPREF1982_04194 [Clostridiales bacterium oral taxon 876 str. F0540]
MAGLFKVGDSAFDGAAGEPQFFGDGTDSRITLSVSVSAISKVHVDGLGTVRQIFRIDGCKITHSATS